MFSLNFLKDCDCNYSFLIKPNLYDNEMIEKIISDFIADKEEIQELLRIHPEKRKKYYGSIIFAFIDVKIRQLHDNFLEKADKNLFNCYVERYEDISSAEICKNRRLINKFKKNVFNDSVNAVRELLILGRDRDIEEMLELVFTNEEHYHNMITFLNGEKKYIMK